MTESPSTGERLAKIMARRGLCSRRDAEDWIKAGRVSVNGKLVKTPAFNVVEADAIVVDGAPLEARQGTRVWLYHKPAGLVVTEKDPEGRPTIFEALEKHGLPRVLTVGRLDINTEGLLLLTNDGGLKRVLELPATGWLRRYRVRAFGKVTQGMLDTLRDGIELEGVKYGPIEATLEREQGSNVWLLVALREGKNREIKTVLAALGLEVNRLIRISFGPFQLGDIPIGAVETVKSRVLKDQLGKRLSEESGADFEAEMPVRDSTEAERPRRPHAGTAPAGRVSGARPDGPARAAGGRPVRDHQSTGAGRRFDGKPARSGERPAGPVRRIHFDDDRAPQIYEEKSYKPRRSGEEAGRPGHDRKGFSGDRKPFSPRPERAGDFDKPRRPRPDGAVASGKPARAGGRGTAPPGAARPARFRPAEAEAGAARAPRASGPKPAFTRADGSPSGRRPRSGAAQRVARSASGPGEAGAAAPARPGSGRKPPSKGHKPGAFGKAGASGKPAAARKPAAFAKPPGRGPRQPPGPRTPKA